MGGKYHRTWGTPGSSREVERGKIANDPDLGKISDNEMAARYGVSRHVSASVRRNLKIPHAEKAGYIKRRGRNCPRDKIMVDPRLGKYHDADIAEAHGVSFRYVQKIRCGLGIPRSNVRMPNFNQELLNQWTRPKGIDSLLEQIGE